jgi:membrane-associated phospholipid phosphatase
VARRGDSTVQSSLDGARGDRSIMDPDVGALETPRDRPSRFGRTILYLAGQLLLFMAAFQTYKTVRRSMAQRAESVAYDHALQILRWEERLGIDVELRLQQKIIEHDWMFGFFNRYYMAMMWMFYACCLVAIVRSPGHYRYLRRVFFCSMVLALPWFYLYPLAPPRFMGEYGFSFIDSQAVYGPLYFSGTSPVRANQFAAMPSMHCGWTLIGAAMLAYALPRRRLGLILGAVYAAVMFLTVVVTGHHYLLDIAGGLVTAGGAFLLAWVVPKFLPQARWRRVTARRPPAELDGSGQRWGTRPVET